MTYPALIKAFDYVSTKADVTNDIWLGACSAGVFKAAGDLAKINAAYHDIVTASLTTYFEGGNMTGPRNQFKKGMVEAFGSAFDTGYTDGGGEMPPDADSVDWLNARVSQELAFIDGLFVQAKELRKDPEADTFAWTTERADGYTSTLQAVYNAAVMLAKKNQMLTWHLGNTEKHCVTCSKLNGQSHRASWYIAHNYIPRQPGASMKCGGYNCDCSLTGKDGQEVTI